MHRNGLDLTKLIKKQDIYLFLFLFALAAGACIWVFAGQKKGEFVKISVDGEIIGQYSLSEDKTVAIEGSGGKNVLLISEGLADMTDADCPDKICVKHKSIRHVGESIVCLPHKVVVEIVSDGKEVYPQKEYDVITH